MAHYRETSYKFDEYIRKAKLAQDPDAMKQMEENIAKIMESGTATAKSCDYMQVGLRVQGVLLRVRGLLLRVSGFGLMV